MNFVAGQSTALTLLSFALTACGDESPRDPSTGHEPGSTGSEMNSTTSGVAGENGGLAGSAGDSAGGAGGNGGNPSIEELCAGACSSQAAAGCEGFDERDCSISCYDDGLYLSLYLECYEQFRSARECEARSAYTCPGPADSGSCKAARDALSACELGS